MLWIGFSNICLHIFYLSYEAIHGLGIQHILVACLWLNVEESDGVLDAMEIRLQQTRLLYL
jgi:hypothetical protein